MQINVVIISLVVTPCCLATKVLAACLHLRRPLVAPAAPRLHLEEGLPQVGLLHQIACRVERP